MDRDYICFGGLRRIQALALMGADIGCYNEMDIIHGMVAKLPNFDDSNNAFYQLNYIFTELLSNSGARVIDSAFAANRASHLLEAISNPIRYAA
ncbi:hypothetical protein TrispH2_007841 [Trichoplax sp. H2]|nr:hypothetical protein TrispH2_007841 [Trichoplax sp. H2]|eukprot:RDD39419.1 hypothetical protein TrispH2_007841 [Trichoplax sp. H2]